jgi:hypothetical protein
MDQHDPWLNEQRWRTQRVLRTLAWSIARWTYRIGLLYAVGGGLALVVQGSSRQRIGALVGSLLVSLVARGVAQYLGEG